MIRANCGFDLSRIISGYKTIDMADFYNLEFPQYWPWLEIFVYNHHCMTFSVSSLRQHIAMLLQTVILTLGKRIFALAPWWVLNREAINTNLSLWFYRTGDPPMVYNILGEHQAVNFSTNINNFFDLSLHVVKLCLPV